MGRILRGHEDRVRGLLWSPEFSYLLMTGSWDSSIRLWDVYEGTCLQALYDHHADVYGLAAHPLAPFSVVSASRDTTVRFWRVLDVGSVTVMRAMAATGCGASALWEDPSG